MARRVAHSAGHNTQVTLSSNVSVIQQAFNVNDSQAGWSNKTLPLSEDFPSLPGEVESLRVEY